MQKTGWKPPCGVMSGTLALSDRPVTTRNRDRCTEVGRGGKGPRRSGREWYTALFVPFLTPVPHTDTDPRDPRDSARVLGIMRFGLLLLSCRGEGL
ncbi:hypothetical protein GCM10010348_18310 [Streptomyces anthocyanicus]|nr:hypothetical protein GCM10010348_18310 [Streptomyces anthocyanicus]